QQSALPKLPELGFATRQQFVIGVVRLRSRWESIASFSFARLTIPTGFPRNARDVLTNSRSPKTSATGPSSGGGTQTTRVGSSSCSANDENGARAKARALFIMSILPDKINKT